MNEDEGRTGSASTRSNKPTIRVVSAAIERHGRYLITQRLEKALLPLLWEFPGGRVEEGESDRAALARELEYRLGVEAHVREHISSTRREYDAYVVELHLYRCDIGPQKPKNKNVRDLAWVTPDECSAYAFAPADQRSMDALLFGER